MTVLASTLISRAQTIVQDVSGVRWPADELLQWLNDGQREVAILKPSASAATVALSLVEGTLQGIGEGGVALLRVVRNLKTPLTTPRVGGRAVRLVARELLDAQHPAWHDPDVFPYSVEARHFCFDEVDPTSFYVFPGNDGTGVVEAVISRLPTAAATPGDAIGLPDVYANALLDYVLYRAYQKDADYVGNAERSAAHYQMFAAALSGKLNSEGTTNPQTGPAR